MGTNDSKGPSRTVVMLGHIDHGKTTLAAAILNVQVTNSMTADAKSYDTLDEAEKVNEMGIP